MRQFDKLLPIKDPTKKTNRQTPEQFYDNVVKPLIPHIIDITLQGIKIDQSAVERLRTTIDEILADVQTEISSNPIIIKFQKEQFVIEKNKYIQDQVSKQRSYLYYLKEYKASDMTHRSYHVNTILERFPNATVVNNSQLPNGKLKWSVKDIKELANDNDDLAELLTPIISKTTYEQHYDVIAAMKNLAFDKMSLYNRKYQQNIINVTEEDIMKPFNPASSVQKRKLFESLKIPCEQYSKETGEPSWSRDEIERVNKETTDESVRALTKSFIDHSFSAIIRANFLAAFDKYTIDGTLYGNLKVGGAKSFRLTSNKPNLLNMPSSASIYAKPLKKCLVAPEGFLVATADFAALEDRVIANISKDPNKIAVFLEGLDGHSLAACYYFKEEIEVLIGPYTDYKDAARKLKVLVDEGNSEAKSIRQKSKPISFGLAYGAHPPKVAQSIGCSIEEATVIYDRYHNELFKYITAYRENVVMPTAFKEKKVYLGLGLTLKTDNPSRDIRTLSNATIQFWSVLTLIALAKVNERIKEDGLEDDIQCISTIYDSIYYNCRNDAKIIQWLNVELVKAMVVPFMEDQVVQNDANMEIGPNWAELYELEQDASQEDIMEVVSNFKG